MARQHPTRLHRLIPGGLVLGLGLLSTCLLGLQHAAPPLPAQAAQAALVIPATQPAPAAPASLAGPAPPATPATSAALSSPPALANLDFAAGEVGQAPPGWILSQSSREHGYTVTTAADSPGGGRSARLAAPAHDAGTPQPPGILTSSFDATPYRGKAVRFRAAVKTAGAGGPESQAQLWLRIDRPEGRKGFSDNMSDRPIREATWGRYEIVGPVAADATRVNLGLLVEGGASASLAAASFDVLGDAVAPEPARPLDDRRLDNLVAFTRLLGYVRYFHPSDQAAAADWNRLAMAAIPSVERAAGPAELARALETLGWTRHLEGDYDEAIARWNEATTLWN
ncbi:MAG: hypothetical protein M3O15_01680, partial [Acidobacteriota bacterium]|nr:hypothetical protein [Acidobacteriota bacterium]